MWNELVKLPRARYFTIGLIFLLITMTAYAHDLYLGGGFGEFIFSRDNAFTLKTFDQSLYGSPHSHANNLKMDVVFGHHLKLGEKMLLGIEIAGDVSFVKSQSFFQYRSGATTRLNVDTSLRSAGGYGFLIRPGYVLMNEMTLFFAVGLLQNNFITQYKHTIHNNSGIHSSNHTTHQFVNGLGYGFSLETPIKNNWAIRMDILQTRYQPWNIIESTTNLSAKEKVSSTTLLANFIWYFREHGARL